MGFSEGSNMMAPRGCNNPGAFLITTCRVFQIDEILSIKPNPPGDEVSFDFWPGHENMARGEDIGGVMHHIKWSLRNCRITALILRFFNRASYDRGLNHESTINLMIILGCMVSGFAL
jgi:hypothetical protein